jgi:hypothetical protein
VLEFKDRLTGRGNKATGVSPKSNAS